MTTPASTSTMPVFDGHNDVLLHLYNNGAAGKQGHLFLERAEAEICHMDMERCREGSFGGGFFAIFIPHDPSTEPVGADPLLGSTEKGALPPALELAYAQRTAIEVSAVLFRLEEASEGQLKVVRTAAELQECLDNGTIAAIMHFEGADAIDPNLDALEVFYRAGLRSLGLVWSRPTVFAEGVPFRFPQSPDTGPGLTDAGRALVRECNRLRIMIDLSHLNEKGFWDVAKLSDAPLVATHSNAHAICASTRNLTDKQLDAIKESDGMVGVNFATSFLREDGEYAADTPLDIIVRHVDYLVEHLGIDRVG